MKKIKSAPANLCLMINRKKHNLSNNDSKNIFCFSKFENDNDNDNNNNNDNDNDFNKNIDINTKIIKIKNFALIKNSKKTLLKLGNLLSDIVSDSNLLSLEDTIIISGLISYFSENILKKDRLKEVYYFSLQLLFKYIILFYIHREILHDKIDNNILQLMYNIKF